MNAIRTTWISLSCAVIALGAATTTYAAGAEQDTLQGSITAAQRYRAAQDGASAIKLTDAALVAQPVLIPATQGGADAQARAELRAHSVSAEKFVRGDNAAADVRAHSLSAEKFIRGDNAAADLRARNLSAEKFIRGDNAAAERRFCAC